MHSPIHSATYSPTRLHVLIHLLKFVTHPLSGYNVIAPSDMMDNRVSVIKQALAREQLGNKVSITDVYGTDNIMGRIVAPAVFRYRSCWQSSHTLGKALYTGT